MLWLYRDSDHLHNHTINWFREVPLILSLWHAKELMDEEYESVYFALCDNRVPFRDNLRARSRHFMRATCRVCRASSISQFGRMKQLPRGIMKRWFNIRNWKMTWQELIELDREFCLRYWYGRSRPCRDQGSLRILALGASRSLPQLFRE